jgi:hypothetical protein
MLKNSLLLSILLLFALLCAGQTKNNSTPAMAQSFFGADLSGTNPWPPTDSQGTKAKLGGIRLWDDDVKWANIETANKVYDWSQMDKWVDDAQEEGYDILYTFGDTPKFAGKVPKDSPCVAGQGSYSCSAPTDVNTDGTGTDDYFSNFVTALVSRYKGQIAYYELWNEPDCTCFFAGTQDQLVRMSKDAAGIIRSIDTKAKILSPSAHGGTMKTWFKGYIDAGGGSYFDYVNFHGRGAGSTNDNPEEFLTTYGDVTSELSTLKITKAVWDDEWGPKSGQTTDDLIASYVARGVILRAGVGIMREYYYQWDAPSPLGLQGVTAGQAHDVVVGWLDGFTISPCTESGSVYTCKLSKGQIVWDSSQTCNSGGCTTKSYTFPTDVSNSHDLEGNTTKLTGKTLQLGVKPLLLN